MNRKQIPALLSLGLLTLVLVVGLAQTLNDLMFHGVESFSRSSNVNAISDLFSVILFFWFWILTLQYYRLLGRKKSTWED